MTAIKRALKIFWLTLVAIAALIFALALTLQLPKVQTFVVGKLVEVLENKIDADIRFEKIHLRPFRTLVLKNVEIFDTNPVMDPTDPKAEPIDTFFYAGYITAKFSLEGLLRDDGIHFDEVTVSDAKMTLVLEDQEDRGDGDVMIDNLSRIFRIPYSDTPSEPNPNEIFHIKNVRLENMGYAMKNYSSDKVPYYGGINWDDLDVMNINLIAHDLRFKDGIMYGTADFLSFREKSGYIVNEMRGDTKVGRGKTIVEDIYLKDPWSTLHVPLYMMSYKNVDSFSDFIGKVRIDGKIRDGSYLDFKTLTYFAPQLEGVGLKAYVSGIMAGCVDDFEVIDVNIKTEDGEFSGTVNGRLTGIPDIGNTYLQATVRNSSMTGGGLGRFINEWTEDKNIDLSSYAEGYYFNVEADADGLFNSLSVNANIDSEIGALKAGVTIDNLVDSLKAISLKGTAATRNLDIGKVISADILGPVTLRTGIDAQFGEKQKIRIDSLFVDRLNFNRYDYTGLKAVGSLSENMFNGTIIASDPNLNFILQGGFALSAKTNNSRYQFYANVTDADLNAINFDKRGKSKLRFETNTNFTRTGDGNILGNIVIADLILENEEGANRIGNINLTSYSNDDIYKIRLRSQFADGSFTGTAPITTFISDIQEITLRKEMPALFSRPDYQWSGHSYNFDFNTHNSMDLLSYIMPGAYVNDGTKINLSIDSSGKMKASLKSKRLAIGNNYIKNVDLSTNNLNDSFSGELSVQEFQFAGIKIGNNNLKLLADNNHLGVSYIFDNQSDPVYRGEFVMNADLSRENDRINILLGIHPSTLYLNSEEWRIQPSAMGLKGDDFSVDSFEIISGDQRIYAYGGTSMTRKDTLNISLERFDLSILNPLFGSGIGIKGAATGSVRLTSPMQSRGLLADMICDSTFIANEPLGTITLGSAWDEEFKRFDIMLRNELDGKRNIDAKAKLTPKSRLLDGKIVLDKFPVKYVEPFVTDVFSEMEGYVSGEIYAEGPMDRLEINSRNTKLEKAMMKIAYTNVPYYADGSFSMDNDGIYFNNISIKDRYTGTGTINGSINWDRFKDMTFDTHIKVNELEGINIEREKSEDFYGNIFGTGNVSITGPVSSLILDIDAITAKTGQLHIPMTGSVTSGGTTNLLKFKELKREVYIDPYEAMRAKMAEKTNNENDFLVKLRVDASPNVDVFVEIDQLTDNVLSARGNGLIELDVSEEIFNINGDYTLTGGKYNFSALGLVRREFGIQDGSSINFSGDIMASTLNIDAIYQTKTSLATLLADDKSAANRRTVDCGIQITERLSNPRLSFTIDVPDLNPMIKSRVQSALSTEDKVQKQFLSLLLSNSFLPDEQSGIVNNTTMLYSNVTEAMANQLSNIFHKLDIPLDLGLNYQPTEQGTDLFDVAVSTQLFNNRVVVNGNIGNKEYSAGNTQNDVVGDLDIEIKLNRPGTLRLNIFSHSADLYSNYLDNLQRNGVGLMYQTEFNNMGQFIRNIFSKKSKRQAAKLAEQQAIINTEQVEMKISGQDYVKKNEKR